MKADAEPEAEVVGGEGSNGADTSSVSVDSVVSSSGRSGSFRNGWSDDGIEARIKIIVAISKVP